LLAAVVAQRLRVVVVRAVWLLVLQVCQLELLIL
jgi:hypothetical protein